MSYSESLAVEGAPGMTKEDKEREEKWKAESDARTLAEAEEIKRDKPRHRRAIDEVRRQIKDLQKVNTDV